MKMVIPNVRINRHERWIDLPLFLLMLGVILLSMGYRF